jgi:ankyrin repeat protein
VEATNDNGCKILHVAAWNGHVDVTRLLLDRGMGLYRCDAALKRAITQGRCALVMTQLTRNHAPWTGADVEAALKDGSTPLKLAAQNGKVDVARRLLDRGMGLYWCVAAPNLTILRMGRCAGHDPAEMTPCCMDRRECGGS